MTRLLDFLLGRRPNGHAEPTLPALSPEVEETIARSEAAEHLVGRMERLADAALSGKKLPESPGTIIRDAKAIESQATGTPIIDLWTGADDGRGLGK